MSNYTKLVNFAAKDSLPSGDAGKIIKGTEINTEFGNIQTAVNSKADSASPAFTGVPTAPNAALGTDTPQLATTAFVQEALTDLGTLVTVTSSLFTSGYWKENSSGLLLVYGRTLIDANSSTTYSFTTPFSSDPFVHFTSYESSDNLLKPCVSTVTNSAITVYNNNDTEQRINFLALGK